MRSTTSLRCGALACAVLLALLLASGAGAATESPAIPPKGSTVIDGPVLPDEPAAGKGRLSLTFSGNRRWCTYPDDRVFKLAERPDREPKKSVVYTFGYQFSIAAVERSSPQTTRLLFESPVVRTATMRQAGKIPGARQPAMSAPKIVTDTNQKIKVAPEITPGSLVPYWLEQNRCATVSERFDFDLDPGLYDVYLAFDLLTRDGGWVHRTTGYLTDIRVTGGERTVLEGAINQTAGGNREVALFGPGPQASGSSPGAVVP